MHSHFFFHRKITGGTKTTTIKILYSIHQVYGLKIFTCHRSVPGYREDLETN